MNTMLKRARHAAFLSSALALAAVGCTGTVPADNTEVAAISSALEQDNGGLTTADEAPAFADGAGFAAADLPEPEQSFADAMESNAAVKADFATPAARLVRVAIVWGQLPPDPTNQTVVDWSGKISINRGALLVRRVIRFEDKTDKLLPRTDKQSVSFTSMTRPANDGLRLDIVDPAPGKEASDPLTLTYENKSGKVLTVAVADLEDGPKTKVIDEAGDRIVAMARPKLDLDCEHGTLGGKWHPLKDGPKGVGKMIGIVRNDDGEPIGHMKGIYGHKKNGDEVFFGKYIDLVGHFKGLCKGHYDHGRFEGRWVVKDGDHGGLGGEYIEDAPGAEIGGHYLGRWAEAKCKLPTGPGMLPPDIKPPQAPPQK